jgi:CTP synthase (UTP-ammonia lyase)
MSRASIALVGERSDEVTAHRAIPPALRLAAQATGADVSWEWVSTCSVGPGGRGLEGFSGVWLVPASPYADMAGALAAVRWAREGGRPFLGTCGGFQHALIEIARDMAAIPGADHAETNPAGADLVVTRLATSLVEATGRVHFKEGSLLAAAYGAPAADEGYRCNFGLNPRFRGALEEAGLRFTAWDDSMEVRGAELPGGSFFAGVLFQPERAALRGAVPPLVAAFVKSVGASRAAIG